MQSADPPTIPSKVAKLDFGKISLKNQLCIRGTLPTGPRQYWIDTPCQLVIWHHWLTLLNLVRNCPKNLRRTFCYIAHLLEQK